ncbi:hypothetical protein F2Q69_00047337 [Brassica cretica]|uniref:Uncharacterized protein n=1 Tax=Brassica cretica TaxID=69181 RepID=A0A8S9PTG7_BRACR|nr:hypothetical protein F2Q69_00047337 [Brassica cretica]
MAPPWQWENATREPSLNSPWSLRCTILMLSVRDSKSRLTRAVFTISCLEMPFRTIMKEEEPIAFYKGIVPGLALFPQQVSHGAIQFTAYEELHKVIVYSIGNIENLNPLIIYWPINII